MDELDQRVLAYETRDGGGGPVARVRLELTDEARAHVELDGEVIKLGG